MKIIPSMAAVLITLGFSIVIGTLCLGLSGLERSIPPQVLSGLCKTLLVEEIGFRSTTPVVVYEQTRPVFDLFALRVLRGKGPLTPETSEIDYARDQELAKNFSPVSVKIPESPRKCTWALPAHPPDQYAGSEQLVLELSNIIEDPFTSEEHSKFGLFAKFSFGEHQGASWYWISLQGNLGSWKSASAYLLPVSDG